MTGVLVVAHLYILNACIERIVSVGAALAVLGLAGFQLVLCRVGIFGRAVRCSLFDQIARCVVGIGGRGTQLIRSHCHSAACVIGKSSRKCYVNSNKVKGQPPERFLRWLPLKFQPKNAIL